MDADEFFGGAAKLRAFSKKLDFQSETSPWREPPIEKIREAPKFGMPSDWVVVKNVGERRQVIGFGLTERDAKILAASQKPEIEQDAEDLELQLISFQPMLEIQARKEGLLQE